MTIIETTLATDVRREKLSLCQLWLMRVLLKVVPLANPDFNDNYAQVRNWWVEIDDDGMPQRELGFDAESKVIVAGPFGDNMGFWTDSNMVFAHDQHSIISNDAFEAAWNTFKAEASERNILE